MKNLSERDREKARKNIAAILKDNAATCGPEQKVIFDSNDSFTAQSAGRTLFRFAQQEKIIKLSRVTTSTTTTGSNHEN
ncbi:hypothetical protein PXV97_05100 [Citrobacter freundii]|nr:hypothetical protein PXV97_05100 [Citrobacter freundii]